MPVREREKRKPRSDVLAPHPQPAHRPRIEKSVPKRKVLSKALDGQIGKGSSRGILPPAASVKAACLHAPGSRGPSRGFRFWCLRKQRRGGPARPLQREIIPRRHSSDLGVAEQRPPAPSYTPAFRSLRLVASMALASPAQPGLEACA